MKYFTSRFWARFVFRGVTHLLFGLAVLASTALHGLAQEQPELNLQPQDNVAGPRPPLPEDWVAISVPGVWDGQLKGALDRYDGVAWYRCQVDVPSDWNGQRISLTVGNVDNCHEAFINGVKVGSRGSFPPDYQNGLSAKGSYVVAANVIRPGKRNFLAVRVYDRDGRGGFKGDAPVLFAASQQIVTAGLWQFRVGDDLAWSKETMFDAPKVFSKIEKVDDAISSANAFMLRASVNEPSLTIPDDLELDLLFKEPLVANPLYINFDERGRMWLVQYRQYPWPAGLKLVSRDKVWRNIYDPPFAPPPPHAVGSPFRGHDRVTIHEDTSGDGKFDKHTVFLDGLNFCTAALKGRGGVYVMNPPYLLYYEDKNNDDVPDNTQPKVLLSGFGFEDSHSLANNLRWGPDGWIYATQGSTVSASIVRHGPDGKTIKGESPVHTMGQNVWRYHPEEHKYEVFAEGGGNAFGVEIDSNGHVFSGHNGGDTRGFHYVQGGYYQKNFGKHGSLSNPYAFAHFPAMKHERVQRFTHTFEIYESTELPDRYHGKLFGVDPHSNYLVHSKIFPHGSSRQTNDIAKLVVPAKTERANWFSPVDIQTGPDGALYIADWYSVQSNHYRNHGGQTNPDLGRVYRLRGKQHSFSRGLDLSKHSSRELVEKYLSHSNRWYRETALRLLGDRKDASVLPLLKRMVAENDGQLALESFWALNCSGGLDDACALGALQHANPNVRRWAVRLLGDRKKVTEDLASALVELAQSEANVETRSQLASTAQRLPAKYGLAIVAALVGRNNDTKDIHIPGLLWWALESHADDRDAVLSHLGNELWWNSKFSVSQASLPACLMRRWAMQGHPQDLVACGKLLRLAPAKTKPDLARRFIQAFEGRQIPRLPDELAESLADVGGVYSMLLGVRRGEKESVQMALGSLERHTGSEAEQIQLIQAIGDTRSLPKESMPVLLSVVSKGSLAVKNAAMVALQNFDDQQVAKGLLEAYGRLPKDAQITAQTSIASRAEWAVALLMAIDKKQIDLATIEQDTIARIRLHDNDTLATLVAKHFPNAASSAEQLNRRIELFTEVIRSGNGVPKRGQALFYEKVNCGKCHTIYGKGGDIGPDLTAYNRGNIEHVLLSLVNPSAEVREGYESYNIITVSGQVLSGFKINENDKTLVIRGIDGQNRIVSKDDIDEVLKSNVSLMPDGLLNKLSDQELRDLFAFLSSTTPPY